MARDPVARMIARDGEWVALRRTRGATVIASALVKAFVRQYGAHELTGGIVQGDYEVIVAAETLRAAGFPDAPRKPDQIFLTPTIVNGVWTPNTGTQLTVQHPGTRGGVGHWIQARGA